MVVGFGAWWTYFTFAGGRQPRPEPAASLQWILGHLPLTAAIAAMGVAMVSLIDHAHEGRLARIMRQPEEITCGVPELCRWP